MGFLSSLGGSALIGGVLGLAGANQQQNFNEEMMERQKEMNVEHYKHRYQWAMEDMQKAGLNPILAATSGIGGSIAGASAASASAPNYAGDFASIASGSSSIAQARTTEKTRNAILKQYEANYNKAVAEAQQAAQNTLLQKAQERGYNLENDYKSQMMPYNIEFQKKQQALTLANLEKQGILYDAQTIQSLASASASNSQARYMGYQGDLAGLESQFYTGVNNFLFGDGNQKGFLTGLIPGEAIPPSQFEKPSWKNGFAGIGRLLKGR